MGPVSVKLIIRAILFASLCLIWLFTFNGRIADVSGELFRCEEVWNHYNRYNPCTASKCTQDCGRRYSAATNKCLSGSELEEDGYEEIIDYGDKEEAERTGAGGNINYDNYKHTACCCNAQAVSVGDDDDDDDEAAAPPQQDDQGPKKFSCSKAFVPEESCVDIRCIRDCGHLNFKRARCLELDKIVGKIQHLTSTDQTEITNELLGEPVGSTSTNSNDDESLACGCYPQQKGEFYICTRAFWDYTEENPCTEMKCFDACIGAGDSFGRCLKRSVIVVDPKYGFPDDQDGLVEDDRKLQMSDDSILGDKLQKLGDELKEELDDSNPEDDKEELDDSNPEDDKEELDDSNPEDDKEELDDSNPEDDKEVQKKLDDSDANDENVQNPDDFNNNDEKVQNPDDSNNSDDVQKLDDSNPNTNKACCCNPRYYV